MRLKVDQSAASAVVVCGCGWRAIALDRHRALELAAEHERQVHPRDMHARAMLWATRAKSA